MAEKESAIAKKSLTAYVNKAVMSDFSSWRTIAKLAISQTINPKWIAEREIGGKKIQYVPGWVATKILNFIFNFNISTKIIEKSVKNYSQNTKYYDKVKKAWGAKASDVSEATVHMQFVFTTKEGEKIEREFISTHKAFENSATAKDDCLKGAISKAWTLAAHSFGIASNVKNQLFFSEDEAAEEQENPIVETTVVQDFNNIPY